MGRDLAKCQDKPDKIGVQRTAELASETIVFGSESIGGGGLAGFSLGLGLAPFQKSLIGFHPTHHHGTGILAGLIDQMEVLPSYLHCKKKLIRLHLKLINAW